jgi:hypothetical protein
VAASPFPKTDAPQAPSPTIVLRTLGGIDALIALGGSRIRSGDAADALGKLKLGLLGGSLDQAMLLRRKSVAADLRDGSEDEKLDQVLGEIDLRLAVELAKAGVALLQSPAWGAAGRFRHPASAVVCRAATASSLLSRHIPWYIGQPAGRTSRSFVRGVVGKCSRSRAKTVDPTTRCTRTARASGHSRNSTGHRTGSRS